MYPIYVTIFNKREKSEFVSLRSAATSAGLRKGSQEEEQILIVKKMNSVLVMLTLK